LQPSAFLIKYIYEKYSLKSFKLLVVRYSLLLKGFFVQLVKTMNLFVVLCVIGVVPGMLQGAEFFETHDSSAPENNIAICARNRQSSAIKSVVLLNESINQNILVRVSALQDGQQNAERLEEISLEGASPLRAWTAVELLRQVTVDLACDREIRLSIYSLGSIRPSLSDYYGSVIIRRDLLKRLAQIKCIWHTAELAAGQGYVAVKLIQEGESDSPEIKLEQLRQR
jgi:hypothetical protein